jgi:transposase
MRYELTDHEWAAIQPMLPNKPRGVPRVNHKARRRMPLPRQVANARPVDQFTRVP